MKTHAHPGPCSGFLAAPLSRARTVHFIRAAALALWLCLGPAQNASANLLLDEPFSYATGALETNSFGAWTNYSGSYFQILVSSSRALLSQTPPAEEVLTVLPGGPYTNGNLYASFAVRCTVLPANAGTFFAQFQEVFGPSRARVFVTTNGAAALSWRVGIANAASSTTNYFASNLALSSLHRLVIRYNAAAGTANLWLDPATEADPSLLATDTSSPALINSFVLRQAPSTTNGVGVLQIDDLKIASSFAEVIAVWDNRWISGASSKWETPANWSQGSPSGSQVGPLLANAPSKTVTIDATTAMYFPSTLTVSNLTLSSPDASTTNTLLLDSAGADHPLVVSNLFTVGAGGALTLADSALSLPGLGSKPLWSPGLYVDGPVTLQKNSLLVATNVSLLAGNFSGSTNGAITLDNSTLQAGNIVLGNADGAFGSLTLNESLVTFPGGTNLFIGGASNAVGALTVNSGQLLAPNSLVFVGAPGSGTVTANGGEIKPWALFVGQSGPGSVLVQGGTVEPGNYMVIGANATGTVSVTSGRLVATNDVGLIRVGGNSEGTLIIGSNGVVAANSLYVATNDLPGYYGHGTLIVQPGGSLKVGSDLLVASAATSTGLVSVIGGTLSVTNGILGVGNAGNINSGSGTGSMLVSNAAVTAASVMLGSAAGGSGDLTIDNGGTMTVLGGLSYNDGEVKSGGVLQVLYNPTGFAFEDPNLRNRMVAGYQRDGALKVTGGTVIAPEIVIGLTNGTGRLNLSSGSVTATSNLLVGMSGSATGLVSVTGGTLSVTNGILGVGNAGSIDSGSGTGSMLVSNATVTAASVMLGSAAGGSGDLTIDNGGTVTVLGGLSYNDGEVKQSGLLQVLFNPTGFAFEDPNLHNRIVAGYQRDGTLKVTGGTVIAPEIVIGLTNGSGALNLTNGSVTVSNLLVGLNSSGTGVVNVAGGTLTATNGQVQVGPAGNGQMNISGGSTIVRQLKLGGSGGGAEGGLRLTGGHLKILSLLSVNAFDAGGGDLDGSGGTVIVGETHNATMVVSGAMVTNVGNLLIGYSGGYTGTFTQDGGMVTVRTNVVVGDCVSGAVGNVTLMDLGAFFVRNTDGTGLFDVRNGTVVLNPNALLSVDALVITNSCARFLKNGGTLSAGSIVLDEYMDADGDGLPNGWEQAHGLDPLSVLGDDGALGDPDHDGQGNLAEYQAGTDPQSAVSVFHLLSAAVVGQNVRLDWTVVGGHSYVVQIATNSTGGITNRFADFSGLISVGGTGEGTTNYVHVGGATNRGAYYRVRLGP
jgi:hypothetical protein